METLLPWTSLWEHLGIDVEDDDDIQAQEKIGKNWFKNMVLHKWNKLNTFAVDPDTIENFKWKLDRFMGMYCRW